jgi:hypothetical protein
MKDNWDQLSILDQWLLILANDLRRSRERSEIVVSDFEQLGEGLRDLLRPYWAGKNPEIQKDETVRELNSVIFFQAHYKQILRQTPLSIWSDMLGALRRDRMPLTFREIQNLERLSVLWKQLESSDRRSRLDSVGPFVEALLMVFGWEISRRDSVGNETVFWLKAPGLKLKVGPNLLLIITFVFKNPGSAERALRWTYDLLGRASGLGSVTVKVGINLIVGKGPEVAKYKDAFRDDFLCFDEALLKEVLTAERQVAKVEEIIKKGISLGRLNPYEADKPVQQPEMFFGREMEIRSILDNPGRDVAVIGARKIGKSSLLVFLRDVISRSISRVPVFIDCSIVYAPDKLAYELALQINPRRAHRIQMSQVSQMVRAAFSIRREPFLLLLDETDRLISFARQNGDWTFFETIRSLANDGVCQTVMTGYKVLFEAWQDRSTPLFNFVRPLYLSVLSKESAKQLVTAPMKELGVDFRELPLIEQLVKESGCHPSFLQFFCSELIGVLAERDTKIVTAAEFNAVREKQSYRQFVMKPFGSDNDFSLFERWLVLSLAGAKRFEFSARDIMDSFGGNENWLTSIAVDRALLGLELGGMVRVSQDLAGAAPGGQGLQYTWTIPAFVRMLEVTTDIDRQIRELRAEFASSRDPQMFVRRQQNEFG